jgi:lysyl-tRNA synthetase class 2
VNKEDQSTGKSLGELLAIRREKLQAIRAMNFRAYEYEFQQTHTAVEIAKQFDEITEKVVVRIAGRIMAIRKMGRASFCHQDESGPYPDYEQNTATVSAAINYSALDIGTSLVSRVRFSHRTGGFTILVEERQCRLNYRPIPIVKEKDGQVFDAFTDKEQRYRQRYLDLIVIGSARGFQNPFAIIQWTRDFLNEHGFLEVDTPILQPIYGGANARPFKTYYNSLERDFYLRIAVELYLKRLIIGGFEKVYEIGKNFRNEGLDRSHNPEFTLLEFYQTYVDYNYMMDFVEQYFRHITPNWKKRFPVWDYASIQ